jgi:hypothetical protein
MKYGTLLRCCATTIPLSGGQAHAQYSTAWISLFDGLSGFHSAEDITLLPTGDVAVVGPIPFEQLIRVLCHAGLQCEEAARCGPVVSP